MRRLAGLSLLILGVVAAAPATAAITDRYHPPVQPKLSPFVGDSRLPGPDIGRDLLDTRQRIERAREQGRISKSEARSLKREARQIDRLARSYGRDGLSASERSEIETRLLYLRGVSGGQASRGSK